MKRWLAILSLIAASASAHEVRPAFLELTERAPGEFDVLWKVPAAGGVPLAGEELPHPQPALAADPNAPKTMPCGCPVPTAAQLSRGVLPIHPSLPKNAEIVVPPSVERLQGAEIKRWTIATGAQGLEGWNVSVHGLEATMVDVLVRIALADGRVVSRLANVLEKELNRSFSKGNDWWDPYIGLRGRYNFSSAIYFIGRVDIGGFGVGSDLMWQAEAALGIQLTRSIYAELGYRALSFDYDHDGLTYDTITHGVQLTTGIEF
jgi:hypothetical protein